MRRGIWDRHPERPPWWPENQAYPPRAGWARGTVMRRMAMFFVFAAVLSVVGATVIFWTLATALGAPDMVGNVARGVALLIVVYGFRRSDASPTAIFRRESVSAGPARRAPSLARSTR